MKFDSFRITSHHSRMISGKLYIIEAVYILLLHLLYQTE